jgi:hypothetical protein
MDLGLELLKGLLVSEQRFAYQDAFTSPRAPPAQRLDDALV